MNEKKKFLLRLESDLYSSMEKWAADDLRSVNAQIEFLLTDAIKKAGRRKNETTGGAGNRPSLGKKERP